MDNNFDVRDENNLTYGRGYAYALQYHIVWCTKYRRPVLVGEIEKRMRVLLLWLAEEYQFEIQAIEVMPDHVHMLVKCKPQFYISDMIKIMKGNTARRLFIEFPEMKKQLWGGHLWNPSYCVVTVSDRSFEQVKHYLDSEKEKANGK